MPPECQMNIDEVMPEQRVLDNAEWESMVYAEYDPDRLPHFVRKEFYSRNLMTPGYARAVIGRFRTLPLDFYFQNRRTALVRLRSLSDAGIATYADTARYIVDTVTSHTADAYLPDKCIELISEPILDIAEKARRFYRNAPGERTQGDLQRPPDGVSRVRTCGWRFINEQIAHLEGDPEDVRAFIEFMRMPAHTYASAAFALLKQGGYAPRFGGCVNVDAPMLALLSEGRTVSDMNLNTFDVYRAIIHPLA